MRIAITSGHNSYINGNFDPGAISYPHVEADFVKSTVSELLPLLKKQGHIVVDLTPYNQYFKTRYDSHLYRCKKVDEFKADIYLDIHLNAGGGSGVEVWVYSMSSPSASYARKITDNISKDINIPNRGVKVNPEYWSLSLTNRPAMIIEGAFIDNVSDMSKITPLKYAQSIAKAFGSIYSENYTPYKVKVSMWGNIRYLDGFKKDGVNYVKIGNNYIPIRVVFESLGFNVDWDNESKTIIIK